MFPSYRQIHRQHRRRGSYLQDIRKVLADVGHVVCSLKQPLAVKLPPCLPTRSLDLGPDVEVGFLPQLESISGLQGFVLGVRSVFSVRQRDAGLRAKMQLPTSEPHSPQGIGI